MNNANLGGTLLMFILVLQSIHALELNETDLPYSSDLPYVLHGPVNSTMQIAYGMYLAGPTTVNFSNCTNRSINVSIDLPDTMIDYTTFFVAGSIMHNISIIINEEILFDLHIQDKEHFTGDAVIINVNAPAGTLVGLDIIGSSEESHNLTGTAAIAYIPTADGKHTATASFEYMNHTEEISMLFDVHDRVSCQISAESQALENESILFEAASSGGIGPHTYQWDFGDESVGTKTSHAHIYTQSGTYEVRLTAEDSEGNTGTCSKEVVISEQAFILSLIIVDNQTGEPVGDANVTVDGISKKSNVNGKVQFSGLIKGTYEVEVERRLYDYHDEDIKVEGDLSRNISIRMTPDEALPVPVIFIKYPEKNITTDKPTISFEFHATSDTDMSDCKLLVNFRDHLGYSVKDTIEEPKSNKDYILRANLSNGDYRWTIACENEDGTSTAEPRFVTVHGISVVEQEVQTTKVATEPGEIDVSEFDDAILQLGEFKNIIIQSSVDLRKAYSILGFEALLKENKARIKQLKQEIINIQTLAISEADRKRKQSEILSELAELKRVTPARLAIVDQYKYEADPLDADFSSAAMEYLRWKKINYSDRTTKSYVEMIEDAQQYVSIRSTLYTVKTAYLDGQAKDVSIIVRSVELDKPGSVYIEMIPDTIAEQVDSLVFSVPYEMVNKDRAVRIYTDQHPEFSYHIYKKLSIDDLKSAYGVAVLDPKHPDNKITGLAILDYESGSGKFFFVLVLLALVLTSNYLIFFRGPDNRAKFKSLFSDMKLKRTSKQDQLLQLLDSTLEGIERDEASAFDNCHRILKLHSQVDKKLQSELMPFMQHLNHALEMAEINSLIDKAYDKMINGNTSAARDDYYMIQSELALVPDSFQDKVNPKFSKLHLTIEIGELKDTLEPETIDDALFQVNR